MVQFALATIGTLVGALAGGLVVYLGEKFYQSRQQRQAAKFEVLKLIRDHLDTLERMLMTKRKEAEPRARRIIRAAKLIGLDQVASTAEDLLQHLKAGDTKQALTKLDELDTHVCDQYKAFLP